VLEAGWFAGGAEVRSEVDAGAARRVLAAAGDDLGPGVAIDVGCGDADAAAIGRIAGDEEVGYRCVIGAQDVAGGDETAGEDEDSRRPARPAAERQVVEAVAVDVADRDVGAVAQVDGVGA